MVVAVALEPEAVGGAEFGCCFASTPGRAESSCCSQYQHAEEQHQDRRDSLDAIHADNSVDRQAAAVCRSLA